MIVLTDIEKWANEKHYDFKLTKERVFINKELVTEFFYRFRSTMFTFKVNLHNLEITYGFFPIIYNQKDKNNADLEFARMLKDIEDFEKTFLVTK